MTTITIKMNVFKNQTYIEWVYQETIFLCLRKIHAEPFTVWACLACCLAVCQM